MEKQQCNFSNQASMSDVKMMKRRDFIKTAGILSGVCLCTQLEAMSFLSTARSLPRFGVITGNTCGKWFKDNPRHALKELAAMGYKDLEFGGSFGMDDTSLRVYLKELKLRPLIGPTSMQAMTNSEQLMKDIQHCQVFGKEYIVCYWPWTEDGQGQKIDDWKVVADKLNKGGEICKKEGLKLLYHNHDIEFRLTEGQIPFDVLLPALNPAYANIELDLYWITKGDQSAETYIRKYPGRYPVYHLKDMDKTQGRGFEYVGDGIIDFPSIFKLNKTAGVKHFIVEHDEPADPERCVRRAATYLSALKF